MSDRPYPRLTAIFLVIITVLLLLLMTLNANTAVLRTHFTPRSQFIDCSQATVYKGSDPCSDEH